MASPTDHVCRDCAGVFSRDSGDIEPVEGDVPCPACGSPRALRHPELFDLSIAHLDCDAFYATVEKRDNPELREKPVIVGGGRRGVVSAACYVARIYGVRSAMPMFKALQACPDAVVIRPDMTKYAAVGRQVRELMRELTPAVEPLSIDEAFLDLTGTERLHGAPPAVSLVRLVRRIEQEIGVTASVGLSYNKFLAKVASDLEKPRGFAVIGREGVRDFLGAQPVSLIWGVGRALQRKLARDNVTHIRHLQELDERTLLARYGSIGSRLYRFSRGEDSREIRPDRAAKSISAETTFNEDLARQSELEDRLWPLCEKVSGRMKAAGLAGRTVVLKLKTDDFRIRTRNHQLASPTQLADVIWRAARPMLAREADGARFRLIGIGLSDLSDGATGDPLDLLDPDGAHRAQVERTMDAVRERLGEDAIAKGRTLRTRRQREERREAQRGQEQKGQDPPR